ncbi:AMP-binding protein [Sulfitobacter pontiacus]|uniref:AMP-binding protein n=1 Tax=Sulfitobacter pontiacus TaxID=60137 RepID=UPI0015DD52A7|nr:AMP-binding protein [Sulfitobacter pontiacus]QLL44302.1 AMP-binding protein [Sulfitobacter pontiacus]
MTDALTRRLWESFQTESSNDFLVSPASRFTYRQSREGIGRWLSAFDTAALQIGDRVVIRTSEDAVAAVSFLAALMDGVVPVLLEGSCPDARLAAIVSAVEPELVFSDTALPKLESDITARVLAAPATSTKLSFLKRNSVSSAFGLTDPVATRSPRLPVEDGLAYLMFTSGTTSEPVGVQIYRNNLAANLGTMTRLFDYSTDSRIFNDMILAHADGIIQGPVLAVWNGCAVLRAGGFEVGKIEAWLAHVRQMRASHVIAVATIWSMIDLYAEHDDYFDAPECKWLMTVADKMPESLMRRIEARFSRPIVNHYGLTETVASALYSGSHSAFGEIGTLGRPIDCEARIGGGVQEGELQLAGDNIFPGYWRNPQRTKQSFTKDAWFRTGDLVREREGGNFEMLGRLKTVIMTGGLLIRPEEIDEAMACHPAVIESATVGLADDLFGEIAVTGVTVNADTTELALTEHLRSQVEPHKVSKRIIVLPEIPRGLSGKPVLSQVRHVLAQATGIAVAKSDISAETATGAADTIDDILRVAAEIFRVPIETLSSQSQPNDVPGWDSFTHINLIFGVENHFGLQLSSAQVSKIRNIGDLIAAVNASR